jgi:LmbE family N-acetylglucosaminyl deacetylase
MPEETPFYHPERALIVCAHADDIEFGAAGTAARWTDNGASVTYCIVTDNSAGSNSPDTNRLELIETRRQEQIAAAATVGVSDVRFLNYPDGTLQPTIELRRELTRLVREVRPQVVVILDPTTILVEEFNYVNHPDHRAAGEAAMYAVFPSAGTRPIFPELLAEGYEPHNVSKLYLMLTTQPNLHIDITTTIEHKLDSLRCHASQIDEEAITMVRQWNAEAGGAVGFGYAESFRVIHLDKTQ